MQDIYDIKGIIVNLDINIWINLIIILIAIIFYFLIFKNTKKKEENKIIEHKKIKIGKNNIDKLILYLKNNIENLNGENFYKKLDELLRNIIYEKYNKDIKSFSLEEIEQLDLEKNLKDFIKSIYFKEYNKNIEDSLDLRKTYLKELEKFYK